MVNKKVRGFFNIWFCAFSKFYKIKSFWTHIYVILSIHRPSLSRSVKPFWRFFLKTKKQTDREYRQKSIYRLLWWSLYLCSVGLPTLLYQLDHFWDTVRYLTHWLNSSILVPASRHFRSQFDQSNMYFIDVISSWKEL